MKNIRQMAKLYFKLRNYTIYMRLILICFIFFSLTAIANEAYRVYDYHSKLDTKGVATPTVFILDYSNSMNERILGESKFAILSRCFNRLVSQIPDDMPVGVRVYGHRWGFTNYDACKASVRVEGVNKYNREAITQKLTKYKPRGMTPITYSLKETIKNDFVDDREPKHIVLVTDGGENCNESPCDYVMELIKTRRDISIDVIAINMRNSDDLDQLRCTADVTSGKLYEIKSEGQLIRGLNNALNSRKEVEGKILTH